MLWSISLVIDKPSGEQVVARPRCTDAVGAALREGFGAGIALPDDMLILLGRIDRASARSG